MSELQQEIIELRKRGASCGAIQKDLGLKSRSYVAAVCRRNGLGGIAVKQALEVEKVASVVEQAGFVYVSGFEGSRSTITVRCPVCCKEFKVQYHTVRDYINGTYNGESVSCKECRKENVERRRKEKLDEAIAQRLEAERVKRERLRQKEFEHRIDEEKRLYAIHVCKNCGKRYQLIETGYNSIVYCSEKCAKRYRNRTKLDKRHRIIAQNTHDNDITLEKLFKRDDGVCYLCGKTCRWDDKITDDSGTVIALDSYPSIEHVIPISKGGLHVWGNVKLACRRCNSLKGTG